MNQKKITISAFILYLIVNLLFLSKYSIRVLPFTASVFTCLCYVLLMIAIVWYTPKLRIVWNIEKKWFLFFLITVLSLLTIIQNMIDPLQLKVDRWSAIHNFLVLLFNGQYPYAAQTHLGGYGSPFPIWQLLHIPFFILGNVGLSFLLATVLFLHSLYKLFGLKVTFYSFLLLILSPAYLYEISVRSDLLTNFLLVCAIICYIRNRKISLSHHWISLAVLCGLIMSTRLSALIPLIVFFFSAYLNSKRSIRIFFPLLILFVFGITFLPFLSWNGEMLLFFEYNPFILQSRQGNLSDFILFIPIGIWLSLSWREYFSKYALHTALLLILLVIVTFSHNMYINNNWSELFAPTYDITYFNMSLPFLIIAFSSQYETNNQY